MPANGVKAQKQQQLAANCEQIKRLGCKCDCHTDRNSLKVISAASATAAAASSTITATATDESGQQANTTMTNSTASETNKIKRKTTENNGTDVRFASANDNHQLDGSVELSNKAQGGLLEGCRCRLKGGGEATIGRDLGDANIGQSDEQQAQLGDTCDIKRRPQIECNSEPTIARTKTKTKTTTTVPGDLDKHSTCIGQAERRDGETTDTIMPPLGGTSIEAKQLVMMPECGKCRRNKWLVGRSSVKLVHETATTNNNNQPGNQTMIRSDTTDACTTVESKPNYIDLDVDDYAYDATDENSMMTPPPLPKQSMSQDETSNRISLRVSDSQVSVSEKGKIVCNKLIVGEKPDEQTDIEGQGVGNNHPQQSSLPRSDIWWRQFEIFRANRLISICWNHYKSKQAANSFTLRQELSLAAESTMVQQDCPSSVLVDQHGKSSIVVTVHSSTNNNDNIEQRNAVQVQVCKLCHCYSATANKSKEFVEGVESKRERKAAKTLSIITGVFVMCWLPFFVMAITMPLLELRPHKYLFALLLWLGYANSMLNPIIYTIFSPDFRKAFKKLLCGMERDSSGNNRRQNGNYRSSYDDWTNRPASNGYLNRISRVIVNHCCRCWCTTKSPSRLPTRMETPSGGGGSCEGGQRSLNTMPTSSTTTNNKTGNVHNMLAQSHSQASTSDIKKGNISHSFGA